MSNFIRRAFLTLALSGLLCASALAQAPQLRGFPTPEAAADALTDAIRKKDDKALTAILGTTWNDLLPGNDQASIYVDMIQTEMPTATTSSVVKRRSIGWGATK